MPNFLFNDWHLDELNVSWDAITCKVIHKKCHYKSYHNDIKNHMTQNTIFSVSTWRRWSR